MARGDGRIFLRGTTYWVSYYVRGAEFREPAKDKQGRKTSDPNVAHKYLEGIIKEKHADEIGARPFMMPKMKRVTIGDLLARLKTKYELNRQDSAQNLSHIKRADSDFGHLLAVNVEADVFDQYKKRRLAQGDALASIQRVLQMVRAAYLRAVKHDKFLKHCVPFIEIVKENNVRTDCYSESEVRKIIQHLPSYLSDFVLFAARTGMRFGEICSLRWSNVKGDVIKLAGEDAKGDGSEKYTRYIPMAGKNLAGILERRKAARQVKNEGTTTLAEFVFHDGSGGRIVDIRKSWRSAIRKAGLRHLVFHTLRHTAVHIMDDAGISRDAAKSITGHLSDSMYSRYNDFSDLNRKRTALEKAQEFAEATAAKEQAAATVVAIAAEG